MVYLHLHQVLKESEAHPHFFLLSFTWSSIMSSESSLGQLSHLPLVFSSLQDLTSSAFGRSTRMFNSNSKLTNFIQADLSTLVRTSKATTLAKRTSKNLSVITVRFLWHSVWGARPKCRWSDTYSFQSFAALESFMSRTMVDLRSPRYIQ